ncbi:hypothetical protein ACROYT_G014347 [Oculina patagonica]
MSAADIGYLNSLQHEADTRMFLHAFHASAEWHHRIAVISSDTDVELKPGSSGSTRLTGWDAVSSFAGKSKKKTFQLVMNDQAVREAVQILGENVPLSEQNIVSLEGVVCKLYNAIQCNSVDELRYKMFFKGRIVQSHQPPPTSAALKNLLIRANYKPISGSKLCSPELMTT